VGFGGSIHDYSTVVADEERLLIGIEDERLTRVRHGVGSADPLRPSYEYCCTSIPEIHSSKVPKLANDTLRPCRLLADLPTTWMGHHYAHAGSSFLTSEFEEAAILVLDGAGSVVASTTGGHLRETATLYRGRGNVIDRIAAVCGAKQCPATVNDFAFPTSDSIGDLYEVVTSSIGFRPLQEGKTMALAAYGDDRYVPTFLQRVHLKESFSFSVELEGDRGLIGLLAQIVRNSGCQSGDELPFEDRAALAFAAQHCLEMVADHLLRAARELTHSCNLCIAGGVALNAVLMGKLTELSDFECVHFISAPGDNGTAVGSALLPHAERSKSTRRWKWTPFLGKQHVTDWSQLSRFSVTATANEEELAGLALRILEGGGILAVYRGGAEFGPRALGHRSILASPHHPGIRSKLNQLKSREWFRPIAPMTRIPGDMALLTGERLMQVARPHAAKELHERPCIHVDGTARVQLVDSSADEFVKCLLRKANEVGWQAILNTSFNLSGQPIVETPEEAVEAFEKSDIDALIIESRLIQKQARKS